MIITSSTPKYTLSTVITENGITTTVVKTTQSIDIEGHCWNLDGAPSDLVATVISESEIDLEFVINSTNHKLHRIYISTDNVEFTELATLTGETNTYSSTGLDSDTLYYFYVVAEKDYIVSAPTNTASGQTLAAYPNGDCTDLAVAVVSDSELALTWVNGSTNEDGISIERSLTGIGGWVEIYQTAAGVEAYNNTGLDFDTTYYYRVRAFKGVNYSNYSNTDSAKTNIPFESELALRYGDRVGLDISESLASLPAKILPSCGRIDANNYATFSVQNFGIGDTFGFIEWFFNFDGTTDRIIPWGTCNEANLAGYFYISVVNKKPILNLRNGTTPSATLLTGNDDLPTGWVTIKFTSTGSTYELRVNDVVKPYTKTGTAADGTWLSAIGGANARDNVTVGYAKVSTPIYSVGSALLGYINYSNKNLWVITGEGTKIFDLIGNVHLVWTGSNKQSYDVGAPSYLLDNGYSVWTKDSAVNEYVPYYNGSPSPVPGALIGYEKRLDYPGSSSGYNFAPSLVDFDYNDSGNALLANFNKANSTIHIATGSMNYYDAANTYRWKNTELEDPRIIKSYKNTGYKGKVFAAATISNTRQILQVEQLVYGNDYKNADALKIATYCGLTSILNGYDVEGYLNYVALAADLDALYVLFLGDSTMGVHASGSGIYQLFNTYTNYATYNIATTGETINEQKARWSAIPLADRQNFDYVLCQIGLNDLANTTEVFMGYYQTMINTILADIKPTCKIVVSTMTPCFGYFTNPDVQQKWLECNDAIAGNGTYALVGADIVNLDNTIDLNNGSNFLLAIYDSGDGLHPNNAGRLEIYNNYYPLIIR